MVAHGRVELLAHPLSQKYLQMKWNSYGKYFHLAKLLLYCIFLTFVTVYTYFLMSPNFTTNVRDFRERPVVNQSYTEQYKGTYLSTVIIFYQETINS